jgi:hypothetical protein
LPGYEVGSALSVLPNVTQNRSCHEKGRSARIYVIIRDGTLKVPPVPSKEILIWWALYRR